MLLCRIYSNIQLACRRHSSMLVNLMPALDFSLTCAQEVEFDGQRRASDELAKERLSWDHNQPVVVPRPYERAAVLLLRRFLDSPTPQETGRVCKGNAP